MHIFQPHLNQLHFYQLQFFFLPKTVIDTRVQFYDYIMFFCFVLFARCSEYLDD